MVCHSVRRRSASCFSAWSSAGRSASSAGSAGSGPKGARRAAGPIDRATSLIDTPTPGAEYISEHIK